MLWLDGVILALAMVPLPDIRGDWAVHCLGDRLFRNVVLGNEVFRHQGVDRFAKNDGRIVEVDMLDRSVDWIVVRHRGNGVR
ncbi:hypothetical protein [Rhizobium leguminosarum]|uniref:hypothetical protein n=1 Tax=Rhizobium leguminosarum TaxID=384 RepID=UPI001C9287A8|nr:hypothetical protein [Rhizobium leguminosarum]